MRNERESNTGLAPSGISRAPSGMIPAQSQLYPNPNLTDIIFIMLKYKIQGHILKNACI